MGSQWVLHNGTEGMEIVRTELARFPVRALFPEFENG